MCATVSLYSDFFVLLYNHGPTAK